MALNDQKAAKIRGALEQLDPANEKHWTDDGLPREGVVRQFASEQNISRKDIQDARPGFQRYAQSPAAPLQAAPSPVTHDPLTGEPEPAVDEGEGLGADPTKNTGELMSEEEVRVVLETRVTDKVQALADAQKAVRDANKGVIEAQEALKHARGALSREFPPLSVADNIKQYLRSEQMQRAAAHGHNMLSGSQIDAAMQRSNSRGWRRPKRTGPVQTAGTRPAA